MLKTEQAAPLRKVRRSVTTNRTCPKCGVCLVPIVEAFMLDGRYVRNIRSYHCNVHGLFSPSLAVIPAGKNAS